MSFSTLLNNLENFDKTIPLVFESDDGPIGAGYHVTELRHSLSTGIDCGANIETWEEARLQLLDGNGKSHMSIEKFTKILKQSLEKLPELSNAPMLVEYSPNNISLKLMTIDNPYLQKDQVILKLRDSKAVCKPAIRHQAKHANTTTDEGNLNASSNCCGSQKKADSRSACCA